MKTIYSHILFLILIILNSLSLNAAMRINSADHYKPIYHFEIIDLEKSTHYYESVIYNIQGQSITNQQFKYKDKHALKYERIYFDN